MSNMIEYVHMMNDAKRYTFYDMVINMSDYRTAVSTLSIPSDPKKEVTRIHNFIKY